MNWTKEERVNTITHALGIVMALVAGVVLFVRAAAVDDGYMWVGYGVFVASMLFAYSMSTVYHGLEPSARKERFRIYDHIAIFGLIAGSYTPFLLLPLREANGWTFFAVVWGIAVVGAIFKLFFTGRFKLFSSALYLLMGWIIVFAGKDLLELLHEDTFFYLIAGGLSYSVGVIFYMMKKMAYSHGIFHLFVLLGTFFHIIAINTL